MESTIGVISSLLTKAILSLKIRSQKRPNGKSLHKDVNSLIREANGKEAQNACI
jgi:hypothetical protein